MPDTDPNLAVMIGEMKGQLRELIHQNNNLSMKVDAIAREVATNSTLPAKVAENAAKIASLEAGENRRVGAVSFGQWLMQSNVVTWAVMAAGFLWALLTGRLDH